MGLPTDLWLRTSSSASQIMSLTIRRHFIVTTHWTLDEHDEENPYSWKVSLTSDESLAYIKEIHFILHETFENHVRVVEHAPYEVEEQGWGEFDMKILVWFKAPSLPPYELNHDVHFRLPSPYTVIESLAFENLTMDFLRFLDKYAYLRHCVAKMDIETQITAMKTVYDNMGEGSWLEIDPEENSVELNFRDMDDETISALLRLCREI